MSTFASLIDRGVAALDPERAVRRAYARAALDAAGASASLAGGAASSAGGNTSASASWAPAGRDAGSDTLRNFGGNRARSRELYATNPIARGAIDTNCNRVVGTGLALSCRPNRRVLGWSEQQAADWKGLVQDRFAVFADSAECDLERKLNFYGKQDLTLRSVLMSADCFTLLPDVDPTPTMPWRLRIQTLEGDRVGNPNGMPDSPTVAGGVRIGAGGAADAYHLYDRHPGSVRLFGNRYKGQWVDAVGARSGRRRMLHHFRQLRPEAPRGELYLAPVMGLLKDLGTYTDAEIKAAVLSAFFTVFLETPEGGSPAPVFGAKKSTTTGMPPSVAMGPGAVLGLPKGAKAVFADPTRPNTAFEPFVTAMLDQVGMALGIPRELLLKRFNASYSASRAALLDAWIWFRNLRSWLAFSFCQPVFETWLTEDIGRGGIPAPGYFSDPIMRWAYCRASWHGDSMGSLNPKDEVAAYVAAIDARLITRERAEWELFGDDWDLTYDQKKAEWDRLVADGMAPPPKAGAAAPEKTGNAGSSGSGAVGATVEGHEQ